MMQDNEIIEEMNESEENITRLRPRLGSIFKSLHRIQIQPDIDITDIGDIPIHMSPSADIFLAKCAHNDMKLAVKRIRVFVMDGKVSSAKKLEKEVRIWSSLEHPNILPLRGFYFLGDKALPNFVSQWMENGTVTSYIKDRPLNANETCKIVEGVASGLDYIHRCKVVHSDLKGSNILMSDGADSEIRPLIADFGLSICNSSSSLAATKSHAEKGTVRWMARELHSPSESSYPKPKHTKESDIWSFGMVIYELLTKKLPFSDINLAFLPAAIFAGRLPDQPDFKEFPNGEIFHAIWSIATKCWNNETTLRPTANHILTNIRFILHDTRSYVEAGATHGDTFGYVNPLTHTMLGNFLKMEFLGGVRLQRFLWVHACSRTLYWSAESPSSSKFSTAKPNFALIESVKEDNDNRRSRRRKIVIRSGQRQIKLTASSPEGHSLWLRALQTFQLEPDDGVIGDESNLSSAYVTDVADEHPQRSWIVCQPRYRKERSVAKIWSRLIPERRFSRAPVTVDSQVENQGIAVAAVGLNDTLGALE